MPSKVLCYLRTLRREWNLSQKELAGLVPGCCRGRISDVEREKIPPKASELLAYAFIFNRTPESIFPGYTEEIEDAVMGRAYRLTQRLEDDDSPKARRKNELLQDMLDRVTSNN